MYSCHWRINNRNKIIIFDRIRKRVSAELSEDAHKAEKQPKFATVSKQLVRGLHINPLAVEVAMSGFKMLLGRVIGVVRRERMFLVRSGISIASGISIPSRAFLKDAREAKKSKRSSIS